jgi:hypothetical protein
MRRSRLLTSAALLSMAFIGSAQAASITTTFAGGNAFAGNMFDLTTLANGITITGIDVNLTATTEVYDISVFTRVGSYVGFEGNAAAWTPRGTVSVTSAGSDVPTFVNIADFSLAASTGYGFYVTVTNYGSLINGEMRYTNGANSYGNADLLLQTGIGLANPDFSGLIFSPRTWNGTIYYTVNSTAPVSEPASLVLFGASLLGLGALARRKHKAA